MFWILAISYWIHLLATAVWLIGIFAMAATAVPAWRHHTIDKNSWLALQKQIMPWTNLSLALLLITGFVQMTNDTHYSGFLAVDSVWAWALLVKHLLYLILLGIALYWQFSYFPAVARLELLLANKPTLGKSEQMAIERREKQLLWLNVGCAVLLLLCTAVMTAV